MGIILIFLVVAAVFYCFLATGLAGAILLLSLYLVRDHHPAWRWPGAFLLIVLGGLLLYRFRKPDWSDADVPEGLRELWAQVGAVVRLWPLIPAAVALGGAGYLLYAQP